MIRTKAGRTRAILVAILIAELVVLVYSLYQRDIERARNRVSAGSQIVETPCGKIEYAVAGYGPPVLVVHGAGGGYDQGLDIAEGLVQSGYRVIAMSRFGYLRTPLPTDASAAAQAEAHACLLDALKIKRAIVMGASAGAPSSMQFALRHPERTAALILLVPAVWTPPPAGEQPAAASRGPLFMYDLMLRSDFLFWAATRLAHDTMIRGILGTPPDVVERASADARAKVERMLEHILPVSPRRAGLLNDAAVITSLPRYELEQIAAPTLLISMEDDLYGTYAGARYSAEHIAQARFIGYPTGGHMGVGHDEEVRLAVASFLNSDSVFKAHGLAASTKLRQPGAHRRGHDLMKAAWKDAGLGANVEYQIRADAIQLRASGWQ